MKNIIVIDGAENCVYDIFAAPDDDFLAGTLRLEDWTWSAEPFSSCCRSFSP